MSSERGTPLAIRQGKTFSRLLRWSGTPYVYVPIASISQGAPVQIVCQQAHGLVDNWPVAVVSAKGMKQINADSPPTSGQYRPATLVDTTKITINDINSAEYSAHTADTGYLQFYTPKSLAGCTARLTVRDKVGGTALLELDSAGLGGITLDDTAKTISIVVSAADTAAMTWKRGVYELEIETSDNRVFTLLRGSVVVAPQEIAT